MKNKKLFFSAALLSLVFAVSCGAQNNPNTPSGSSGEQDTRKDTPSESVTEAAKAIDTIGALSDLDFGGQKLTIDISVNEDEWNSSSVYVMGADEEIGDDAKDLVYRRNMEIAEALNVTLDWNKSDYNWDQVQEYITKTVMSGCSPVDLFINDQYGLIRAFTAGCLYDIYSIDDQNSYFDFSCDGWYSEYMDELSVLEGRRYFLAGDYFMDLLRGTHVMYFNKNLMSSLFEGADELYNTVAAGQWTYDKLIGYIKDSYRDLNQNGSADPEDLYGIRLHTSWSNLYLNTTDCHTTSRDKDGNLFIDPSVDRISTLADKLLTIYSNPGYCNMPDGEGTDKRIGYFINGQVLFTAWLKIADLEADEMRNMDGIGLIPYPKLDESQDSYRSLVHNISELGAIPTSVNEKNLPALSAYLQAMTQYTSECVMPAYFETALKIKYSQDAWSAKMLDLIRDGIRSPFQYAYNDYFKTVGYNALSSSITKNTNVVVSSIDSGRATAEKQLADLMDVLQNLE